MGNSLFEQLKNSGLVDKNKAKKIKQSQYKNTKQKSKKGSIAQATEATLLSQKAHTEKIEHDRLLNQQQKEATERKAIAAQIKQLIESNCIKDRDGDIVYNFADGNRVKHLYVSQQIHQHITSGRLLIAKLEERYELVPAAIAEKIKQRDTQCIIRCEHITEPKREENDPYADYKIPDDLMW
ncbi:MAG: DUF2058 domain-containing protein [Gammaproteobacteria bacterium]|nr:DUF2058 domain-containing protein [Gammaproteobacteria bacterium]